MHRYGTALKVKKIFCVLLVVCMAAGLFACADGSKSDIISGDENTANKSNKNGVTYTLLGYIMSVNKVCTGSGYYDIVTHTDGSANMMYTDFATAHRMYLSSEVNSAHDTAEDTSYIQYMLRGINAYGTPNYLYAVKDGTPALAEEYGEEGQCYFEQMSYTGENHRRLYLEPTAYISSNGQLAYDGENIIMVVINYTKGTDLMRDSEYEQYLAALNEETGKETRLYNLDTDFTYGIVGAGVDCLFLRGFRQVRNTETNEIRQEFNLISINPQTGEKKELFFCDDYSKNIHWINYERQMCYLNFEKNQFIALSENGTETVLCENVIPDKQNYDGARVYCSEPIDNKIIFVTGQIGNAENVKSMYDMEKWFYFVLDMNNKTVTESKSFIDGEYIPVEVVGDEYYMVFYGRTSIPYTTTDEQGNVYPHDAGGAKRWLIKKDDYWSGNMQLIEITDDLMPR